MRAIPKLLNMPFCTLQGRISVVQMDDPVSGGNSIFVLEQKGTYRKYTALVASLFHG